MSNSKYLDKAGLNKLVNDYLKPDSEPSLTSEHPLQNKVVSAAITDQIKEVRNLKSISYGHVASEEDLPSSNSELTMEIYTVGQRLIADSNSSIYEVTAVDSETGDITWTKTNLTLGGGKINATAVEDLSGVSDLDDGYYLNIDDGKVYEVKDGVAEESTKEIDTCKIEYELYYANKTALEEKDILFIIINSPGNVSETEVNSYAPIGTIVCYAGATPPEGWAICDGSTLNRANYSELFKVIGTTYGAGDGTSTFGLPNLSSETPTGTNYIVKTTVLADVSDGAEIRLSNVEDDVSDLEDNMSSLKVWSSWKDIALTPLEGVTLNNVICHYKTNGLLGIACIQIRAKVTIPSANKNVNFAHFDYDSLPWKLIENSDWIDINGYVRGGAGPINVTFGTNGDLGLKATDDLGTTFDVNFLGMVPIEWK